MSRSSWSAGGRPGASVPSRGLAAFDMSNADDYLSQEQELLMHSISCWSAVSSSSPDRRDAASRRWLGPA